MHGTKCVKRSLGQIVDIGQFGDIRLNNEYRRSLRFQIGGSFVQRIQPDPGQHNFHPFFSAALGNSSPNATPRARNDSDLTLKLLHSTPSFFRSPIRDVEQASNLGNAVVSVEWLSREHQVVLE